MPGTYHSAGGCQNCTVGTYQDLDSQESCKPCPSEKNTTETTGAKSDSYCISKWFVNCNGIMYRHKFMSVLTQ